MKIKARNSQNNLDLVSQETKSKVEIAKKYIERKYQKNFEEERRRKEYYDDIISKMQHLNLDDNEKETIKRELIQNELNYLRQKRQKESINEYESLAIIGRGAFGEVRLCRHRATRELVAVKRMSKQDMNKKNQLNHIRAERDILASSDGKWIVELKSSFTDEHFLYLVMEYLPGGDLMNLLMEKDVFTEDQAQFYMAEMVLAVETVHQLNYIHRDLKPDNILIDKDGHIKLTDFGLCKLYEQDPFKFATNLGADIQKCIAIPEESANYRSHARRSSKVASLEGVFNGRNCRLYCP